MVEPISLIDDLPMEEEDTGLIAIGDPDPDWIDDLIRDEPGLREWDDNLASTLPPTKLTSIAEKMISDYDTDVKVRDEWLAVYKEGLKSLSPSPTPPDAPQRSNRKLSTATHPLIAEAATQFQARAIGELFPPSGPVGTQILGDATEDTQKQSRRISTYMNYQLTEEMEEYFPDQDQMLFHLPLVGQTYKKPFFDVNLGRITSRFIKAEDFVMEGNSNSLRAASRYHHRITLPRYDYDKYVENDFYLPLDTNVNLPPTQSTTQEIDGVDPQPSLNDDNDLELIETHCYLDIESNASELPRPFVVTTHKDTRQIVAIRRNWDEGDTKFKKNIWFVEYKFLPGLGAYGFGLYHIIGSLGKAATGSLRALLDAAAFSNMQGGFKLRGRVKGGETEIGPGEFVDIDAAVDDVKKAIMPLPFKEPSQTMMQLLQYIVETGKKFANTVETNLSDANQNTPVGTTMALLEENSRVFSAVHKRLHNSQRQEFKLIAKLNGIYLPEQYPYRADSNPEDIILRKDFDSRIDVIPVSDPATFSSTQRISQAQAMLQMSKEAPHLHNQFKAYKRMYEALRIPNYDEVLIDPSNAVRQDAVAENVAIMHNRPIKVYEDQDHMAHISVLDGWFSQVPPDMQQLFLPAFTSHRAEHMALYYRAQVQAQLGAPLPPVMQKEEEQVDLPAELDAQISQAAAQVVMQNPQQPIGPPPPQPQQNAQQAAQDPMAAAQMMAQAAAMEIQVKAEANAKATMMKAQQDMEIKQANAQLDMKIDMIREKYKNEERLIKAESNERQDDKKLEAELERMEIKANAEIQIAREKAQAQLSAEQDKHNQKQFELALDKYESRRSNREEDDGS